MCKRMCFRVVMESCSTLPCPGGMKARFLSCLGRVRIRFHSRAGPQNLHQLVSLISYTSTVASGIIPAVAMSMLCISCHLVVDPTSEGASNAALSYS